MVMAPQRRILLRAVGHLALNHVTLEVEILRILRFKNDITRRHLLRRLHIGIDLKVDAAFQFGALSSQLFCGLSEISW